MRRSKKSRWQYQHCTRVRRRISSSIVARGLSRVREHGTQPLDLRPRPREVFPQPRSRDAHHNCRRFHLTCMKYHAAAGGHHPESDRVAQIKSSVVQCYTMLFNPKISQFAGLSCLFNALCVYITRVGAVHQRGGLDRWRTASHVWQSKFQQPSKELRPGYYARTPGSPGTFP